jgi:hypothetical protein
MNVVFLFPLALSVTATVFFVVTDEIGFKAKIFAVVLTGTSILLQFVPPLQVHFFIPFAMQLIICFWFALFWKTR